jgi:hypothetical protein
MMTSELEKLLDAARRRKMTPDELEAQRVSFAFGNAPDGECGSIESVRAASTIMKESEPSK